MDHDKQMSYNLRDYVYKIEDFLDQTSCKTLVKKISNMKWNFHSYYDPLTNTSMSYDNELSVLQSDIPEIQDLNKKLNYAIEIYLDNFNLPWFNKAHVSGFSPARMNRYDNNTIMKLHCDHINSLFDGSRKGVPIITLLGSLNNNYTGGELVMFGKEVIELKAGNILVFPSNFLFPHEVKPVLSGTRYSYVSWVW